MGQGRWKLVLLLAVGGSLASASRSDAGWPWLRPRCWDRPQVYAPGTTDYVVVAPAPVPVGQRTCPAGTQEAGWELHRAAPAPYPWGWFGTRTSQQPMTHTGYYGNYQDRKLLREW